MKKFVAFFMTALMVCSMGVTTAFGATAKASADKVAVNGQQVKMQALTSLNLSLNSEQVISDKRDNIEKH